MLKLFVQMSSVGGKEVGGMRGEGGVVCLGFFLGGGEGV